MKILELPGLAIKGDPTDWKAAGGTAEELKRLAAEAPEWVPVKQAPTAGVKVAALLDELEASIAASMQPVDGAVLLDDIAKEINRFMVMKAEQLTAVTLWVLVTYVFDAFDLCAYLELKSPTKQCGKTRLLEVLEGLCARARNSSGISQAALFRVIEADKPTLLLDEQEDLKDKPELLQILNAGYRVSGTVTRCGGPNNTDVQTFSVYCPKAFASIKGLPEVTASRCIAIELQRKHKGEATEYWRCSYVKSESFVSIRRRAGKWAADNFEALRKADPELPATITNDRQQDNWRALLAVADLAGGEWPGCARKAAASLSDVEEDSEQASMMLLSDVRDLFEEMQAKTFFSTVLQEKLVALESRPWSEWRRGKPITTNAIAGLLKEFKVFSTDLRDDAGKKFKGYRISQFDDAFTRYLPSNGFQTSTPRQPRMTKDLEDLQSSTKDPSGEVCNVSQPSVDATLAEVSRFESVLGGVKVENDSWVAGSLQRETLEDGSSYDMDGNGYPTSEDTSWEG